MRPGEPLRGDAWCAAAALAAAAAGVAALSGTPPPRAIPPRLPSPAVPARPAVSSTAALAAVRALWRASRRAADTPAAAYLAARLAWPPAGSTLSAPLPPGVRWTPRAALEALRWREPLPTAAPGAITYGYAPPRGGPVRAVQLDALDAEGGRTAPRWRFGRGARSGSVFRAAAPWPSASAAALALCEGEVTALALAASGVAHEVRATGGHGGLDPALVAGVEGAVLISADGDPDGRRAMRALAHGLREAGRVVAADTWERDAHRDAADELADAVRAALEARTGEPGE